MTIMTILSRWVMMMMTMMHQGQKERGPHTLTSVSCWSKLYLTCNGNMMILRMILQLVLRLPVDTMTTTLWTPRVMMTR